MYDQAVAEIAYALVHEDSLTVDDLDVWLEERGMQWRWNTSLDRKITPPEIV